MKAILDDYLKIVITTYRRLSKEEGPLDKLQTREFRTIVEKIKSSRQKSPELSDPTSLFAYLLYDSFVQLQQGLSLIGEIPQPPGRVLDLFSKTGAFSLAALMKGAREALMLGEEENPLEIGSQIIGKMGYPVSFKKWKPSSPLNVQGSFDLIIAAYPPFELTETFIQMLLGRLTPNGQLLIVDDSETAINLKYLSLRDKLVASQIPVQAPCVWKGECPALKSNSPCYAQREFYKPHVIAQIQRAGAINLSSLKMTYLILRNKPAGWPPLSRLPVYRVISPPLDSFQGKQFYLCGTDGKKTISSRLKEHPKESRAFEYLKRGELIYIKDALVDKNHYNIIEDSEVKIEAALGKPVGVLEEAKDQGLLN